LNDDGNDGIMLLLLKKILGDALVKGKKKEYKKGKGLLW